MVKIGVFGGRRGDCMIEWCKKTGLAEITAICDKDEEVIAELKRKYAGLNIAYYGDFDSFVEHKMDGMVLANYAHEHAPYAVAALKKGIHVLSEVLPFLTLAQGAELVEAVERSGKIYSYAENYCFMPAPREMRKLYRAGKLGAFEYGEGEYVHNCEPIWADITYGERDHWRNRMYSTFYCTHSFGPLVHITGMRPVKVTGIELPYSDRAARQGSLGPIVGMEMVTMENGAVVKSLHGGLDKNSIWYSVYGTKGRMESSREDAECNAVERIYVNFDEKEGVMLNKPETYLPTDEQSENAKGAGHGSSDYYIMYNFVKAIKGEKAEIIDVYEACDMFLPGMFAYFSILDGNKPQEIPNFRKKSERDKYRHDTRCTISEYAGDMLLPCCSTVNVQVPDAVYDRIKEQYRKNVEQRHKNEKLGT